MRLLDLVIRLHKRTSMTRFDRTWEPFVVLLVAFVLLFGTRC